MAIKRCKAAFAVSVDGVPRMVTVGQLVDASDPVIKGREALFEDVETFMSDKATQQAPKVEQATAEPGEKRSVAAPTRKPLAKKTASRPSSEKSESGREGTS